MSASIRLENENLGSHHFDALREKDEAQALEEVRLKERELEQEAVHAFDDLLDASGSEASSYYKPPLSQQENGNLHEELYLQSQRDLEKLQDNYDRLRAENNALRANFDAMAKEKSKLEEKLDKSEVRINLLEQEVGELSDAQTVHRVKDQYETIIEKLKSGFHREKGEILTQLNKFKEEALLARNHICRTSQVGDDRAKALESELESLRCVVDELREKELQLQLTVKEQSMMLKENDLSEDFDGNFIKLCELLDVDGEATSFNSAVMECYDQVVDFKNRIKELECDVASSTRLCQELRIAAKALEKENLQLKDKLEHSNSDTESHSETTRLGALKGALEKLEAENLHLRLQVQTLEESRDRLQLEIKNRINQDSKSSADINELLAEKQRLLNDFKSAQEFSAACQRAQEMAEEVLRKRIESFELEREQLRREIEKEANQKLQDEVHRMEVQFANEVSQRGEMGDKLRKACLMMLEERLAKICKEKDAEIARLTTRSQEEIETMHERLTVLQDEVEELRRETVQAVREKQVASEKLEQAQEELENLKEEVSLKQDKLSRLRSQLEDLKIDRESRAGQLAEQEKKMRLLENLVKSGKSRVDRANKERESIEKELKSKLDQCMDELKSAKKKLASLQPEIAVHDEEQRKNAKVLEETCEKLVADLEQTRQKLSESNSEAESLRTILKHKVSVMEKIKDDLLTFQGQGRRYVSERQMLLDTIGRLEEDLDKRRKRDIELRNAMGLIAEKVIERLQARHRVL